MSYCLRSDAHYYWRIAVSSLSSILVFVVNYTASINLPLHTSPIPPTYQSYLIYYLTSRCQHAFTIPNTGMPLCIDAGCDNEVVWLTNNVSLLLIYTSVYFHQLQTGYVFTSGSICGYTGRTIVDLPDRRQV